MVVVDGLGGIPHTKSSKTELETANIPNLDKLASGSARGLTNPVMTGVTPGSGPGHMALFGYDPVKYLMGRGVLEALGIGLHLDESSVAARGNFCTVNSDGNLIDRRAGRISTHESTPLVTQLNNISLPGVNLSVHMVKDHRFVLVLKGPGLHDNVSETDPQSLNTPPLIARGLDVASENTATLINTFVSKTESLVSNRNNANMILLRGFSKLPDLPNMSVEYELNPAAIAAYPMYRGLAQLVGMKILKTGQTFDEELLTLENNFNFHDFFFIHYKPADAAGEDGDFDSKVSQLEKFDTYIPRLLDLNPDVLVIAGDHSTPAIMGSHSWHPVPLIIKSALTQGEGHSKFSERSFHDGSIGRIPATHVMMLALANAGKLTKFGP